MGTVTVVSAPKVVVRKKVGVAEARAPWAGLVQGILRLKVAVPCACVLAPNERLVSWVATWQKEGKSLLEGSSVGRCP